MNDNRSTLLLLLLLLLVSPPLPQSLLLCVAAKAITVTYDHRALVIDGKRRVLNSGAIHYPRSTPQMWPDLIRKSKDGGLDVIETYVFWNRHEPVKGQYNFEGRNDLVGFVKAVANAGLYVFLRIGPYVCAEWNYGGFPLWLHLIPGIALRTNNELYKLEMQRFTTKIVDILKKEKLFAWQGGPIILTQIENEYGNVERSYGRGGKAYGRWAASMAIAQNVSVPWVMCQQPDAPDPIINTCNGFYCDHFEPNSYSKPKIWTENWTGWFNYFGGVVPYRPVEDLAFAVARFFQRGGTFQNYYMYHGGTNFGHTSGGPFISTSYDYDAPLDEYGMIRQPKWGHLKDLHKSIKLCEEALVAADPVETTIMGQNIKIQVYKSPSGACAAFLANIDSKNDASVTYNGNIYHVPAWSVSILPDCQNVVFNTAQINSQSTISVADVHQNSKLFKSDWLWIAEPIGIWTQSNFTKHGLLEQIRTTADVSDYLWYSIRLEIKGDEPYLYNGSQTSLSVNSLGHVLVVFVNGEVIARAHGRSAKYPNVSVEEIIFLKKGGNDIYLLSATVGLQNYGAYFDRKRAGVTGPVLLRGNGAHLDLSSRNWTYQVGLMGEELKLSSNTPANATSHWAAATVVLPKNMPLMWYKTSFDAPGGSDPVSVDLSGMVKGEAWVNGHSIGRYWLRQKAAPAKGCSHCSYRGPFRAHKCNNHCGPSQSLYHVPRSLIQETNNVLTLFEEVGGDPTQVSFVTRRVDRLCSKISELHPPPVDSWISGNSSGMPELRLECPNLETSTISSIEFASFGNPHGECGNYSHGDCSSQAALSVVRKTCIGSSSCRIPVSADSFGGDPCKGVVTTKTLAVEATCSSKGIKMTT